MKRLLTLLLLLATTAGFAAETSPKLMAEQFLGSLQEGKTDSAYENLFRGSTILADRPQEIFALKSKASNFPLLYSDILGYELIHEENLGSSLVRLVYLLKLNKQPILWEFYFYKPRSAWFVYGVKFEDQFNLLASKK